jgi:hypothetical protein
MMNGTVALYYPDVWRGIWKRVRALLAERGVFSSCLYFVIFIFGNFRLTAATTEVCSGFPELLAKALRA